MIKGLEYRKKGKGFRGLGKALFALFFFMVFGLFSSALMLKAQADTNFFQYRSIDTMKYSRDAARANLPISTIDKQIDLIAKTGANYVAIGTPYDEEFYPVLKEWVTEIRKYHMNVWFRGNFSGWEGWFDRKKDMTRDQHLEALKNFLEKHQDLFQSGDVFVSCPECENGSFGDPRFTGKVKEFRQFLITEKQTADKIFAENGKNVQTGFYSMNGDVARLVMDKDTTKALGGYVTIDHYVATPEKLSGDIKEIAKNSGGRIILGEFGAPIPDIHGDLNEDQQADWVNRALGQVVETHLVDGVNYWVGFGGSTKLWNDNYTPRKVVAIMTDFYSPDIFEGSVVDQFGNGVGAYLDVYNKTIKAGGNGWFAIPISDKADIKIYLPGYNTVSVTAYRSQKNGTIVIDKKVPTIFDKLKSMLSCFIIFCK